MILADDVWGDDELPVGMRLEIFDEDFFIGRPRRAGYEHLPLAFLDELLDDGQLAGLLLDLQDAVEAGVARDADVGQPDGGQQLAALLVLHEEVGEALQDAAILTSIPSEEHLSVAEDARHAVGGHAAMLQDVEVVVPELILDEEGHLGPYEP